jgi:Cd(II)/Pb(II)-responsive transcriptional regulator
VRRLHYASATEVVMKNGLKIGELARRTGTQVETIRYYERESLLPAPSRSEGNYRVYDASHVERLSFIRHCRALDMTLDEIRVLLRFRDAPDVNCAEVNALLDAHIGHVTERIDDLGRLEKQLKSLRRLCRKAEAAKDCGILHELARPEATPEPARRTRTSTGHVQRAHTGRVMRRS